MIDLRQGDCIEIMKNIIKLQKKRIEEEEK